MNVNDTNPDATGLEQLQALIASGKSAPIGETLKFRLVDITDGQAVFEAEPGRHAYNPIGTVHGGFAATLLDSACGCAVHSKLRADQIYTTLELKVAYHRAMTEKTGTIRAIGSVMTIGRRTAYAEGRIVDANDRLLASATSTLLVMERP
ncbi:PaaI family thioesterase [Halopseudomonas salegens]|uniref:Uncharacterized domain 1-containing protein n=1 Tax=Halopseudomonas salegens TaxID=1434072 RepID=A0A1H2HCU3_9GAMM|nr:PaaI family thioesterase [Halopseudomonas salegens]SDU29680.1 uncharacterized domain 1-containing protein [Halopseudomonas salegens]